jgi:hypothetical protein
MNTQQQHIIEELKALEAFTLADLKAGESATEFDTNINDQMVQGVLNALPEMESHKKVVSIKEGMRREKISGFSFFLRIAGTVAIIVTMGIMGYKTMNFKQNDCAGKDELACLMENTSQEEMLYYLMENTANIDEEHILEAIPEAEVSNTKNNDSTELFEIDLL